MVLLIIDDGVLARGDALYLVVALYAVEVADAPDVAVGELRRVPDFEGNLLPVIELAPGVFGDKVEAVEVYDSAILRLGVVAIRDVDDVPMDVLLDDEPRPAAQSQSLALADGVKPITVVLAKHLSNSMILPGRLPK